MHKDYLILWTLFSPDTYLSSTYILSIVLYDGFSFYFLKTRTNYCTSLTLIYEDYLLSRIRLYLSPLLHFNYISSLLD